jgi:lysophospholipase L1-like esterase
MANHYNAKITFILQPYANWLTNRPLTHNEKQVFEILDRLGGESGRIILDNMNDLHQWYSKELSKACDEQNINYYDSNNQLNKDIKEDIFVDRVHLTDYGNKILSNFILEKI